jgi:hypothetical protein
VTGNLKDFPVKWADTQIVTAREFLDAVVCVECQLNGGVLSNPAAYVQPIHFENFDGSQFERLVFAYHARTGKWKSLEWYGQTGSDLGRDIWGVREPRRF